MKLFRHPALTPRAAKFIWQKTAMPSGGRWLKKAGKIAEGIRKDRRFCSKTPRIGHLRKYSLPKWAAETGNIQGISPDLSGNELGALRQAPKNALNGQAVLGAWARELRLSVLAHRLNLHGECVDNNRG